MVFVDTSVWIDVFNKVESLEAQKLLKITSTRDILVGDLVMYEVLRGARDDLHARRLEKDLRRFRIEPILSPAIAQKAAENYRKLRSLGITIRKDSDIIIGTFCIENGHILMHRDRDFLPMVQHLDLEDY